MSLSSKHVGFFFAREKSLQMKAIIERERRSIRTDGGRSDAPTTVVGRVRTHLHSSLSLSLVRACVWVARYETVAGRRTRQRRGRRFSSACNASFLCFVLTKKYDDDDDDGTRAAAPMMMHRRLSTTNDARHACYLNTPRNPARQSANVPRKTTDVVARRSARDCSRSSTSSSKKESRLSTAATRSAIESREVPISSERSSPSSSSSSVPESLGRGTPKRWNNASIKRSSVAFKDFVFVRRKKRIDQKRNNERDGDERRYNKYKTHTIATTQNTHILSSSISVLLSHRYLK